MIPRVGFLQGQPSSLPPRDLLQCGNMDPSLEAISLKTGTVLFMMVSSHGDAFYITVPLWGEFTGHWWIPPVTSGFPSQRDSNVELWCFLCYRPEETVKQTVESLLEMPSYSYHITNDFMVNFHPDLYNRHPVARLQGHHVACLP